MKKHGSPRKALPPGFRIVALGGGTGLSTLLRGLKERVVRRPDELSTAERPISDLAAIVTVTEDRKSTRLNSSHGYISYAVFCLKKKKILIKLLVATISVLPL